MTRFLRLEAVVRAGRHEALTAASDAIAAGGGWIVDHNLLSDVMAMIAFAVPANRVEALARSLDAAGFAVDAAASVGWPDNEEDVRGQLTLMFASGTGDLTHERPAFH